MLHTETPLRVRAYYTPVYTHKNYFWRINGMRNNICCIDTY